MEGLIRLVAESFVRHGLEVEPAAAREANSLASEPQAGESSNRSMQPLPTETLPEHNYRKKLEVDLVP